MKKFALGSLLALFMLFAVSCSSSTDTTPIIDEVAEEETPTPPTEEDGDTNDDDGANDDDDNSNDDPDTSSQTGSIVQDNGQLHIEGSKIMNEKGELVQLRGMSFFWSQWIGKYYTPEVVKWLKDDWQCTVVRAAMAFDEVDGYLTNPDVEKQKVFAVVDAAIAEGLYVIVDLHSHNAENFVDEAKSFFSEVAQKYGNTPNIIYETYNEPINATWAGVLKPYHETVLASIRQHDPDNIVICGTQMYSQRVDDVIGNTIDDPNVAYTLHYYSATHKQDLRDIAQQAIDNDIPLFVTEYGITEASGGGTFNMEETNRWWDFLDENSISSCNWSLADKDELSAVLKPGASTLGGWTENDLSEAGKMIRAELKAKNPKYEN